MADGAVNFLLDKLTTILLQEASLLGDAYSQIEEIKLELESMRSFIKDAERRRLEGESVETWVRQVREVSQKAEDIVDEFLHYKGMWQDIMGFKGFLCLPKYLKTMRRISLELREIKSKVQDVADRSKRYRFDDKIEEGRSTPAPIDWWQHHGESSIFDQDDIVGMSENIEKLMHWLIEDNRRRTIISIVGMGGLGKTTLVTKVYNDQVIKRHFDCWAWISVTQFYKVEDLLRSMVKDLFKAKPLVIPSNLGLMNYRQLVEMLIEYLQDKRYVIVLDDVWSIDLWSKIRGAFPNNNLGSRIIFTTRNENVATSVGPGRHVHRLEPLKESDAWDLFCKKAFWNQADCHCPPEIESQAQAIMRKCEGLPLAIVAIGGLMCSRNRAAVEWRKVCDSLNWELSNNPMLERVKGILLLSFSDLPFYLKHCFLHCCVFRDGYPIQRKKLIRIWIAEGFIIERKGMTLEEVAEEYLKELIVRSMIQVLETNETGRVKSFKVHDVMRELAMTTSERENFCITLDGRESRLERQFQRLSVYNRGEKIRLSRNVSRHLRSFFVFEIETDVCSTFSLNAVLPKFKLLRVLDLQGASIETIPAELVELFNLKYLNIRGTNVRVLPKSMERLKNLQTLDVRNTNLRRLPNKMSSMKNLRHLFLSHDNDSGMWVPTEICNIRSLQTLACVAAEEELIQQLKNLTELKRLDITRLKAVDGPKLCNSIQKMTGLLRLSVVASRDHELQLEDLSLAPVFLQKLTLVGKLNNLPHWVRSLANLTHLHLGLTCLQENILFSLQTLPTLFVLELKKAYRGKLLHFRPGGFPKLNILRMLDLEQLESVIFEEGALPSIKQLSIVHCPEVKLIPRGIEHLTSLQKLLLEEMPEELVDKLRTEYQAKVQHTCIVNHVFTREGARVVEIERLF